MAFEITESGADYHLTLLLSPFGFTTYMKNSTDSDHNTTTDSSQKDSPLNETSNVIKHIDTVINNNTETNIDFEMETSEEILEESRQGKSFEKLKFESESHENANFLDYPADTIATYNEKVYRITSKC